MLELKSFKVLPAHAGVILSNKEVEMMLLGITRTCGGDPSIWFEVLQRLTYYPHMRG